MADEWQFVFYIEDSGEVPVETFLSSLDAKARTRFDWALEQLRVRNAQAREPLVKPLGDKLYELRVESKTNIYRVMYFFFTGRQIVLLHGFQKKSQKTPAKEITTAMRRMGHFIERQKGVNKQPWAKN